LYVKVVEVIVSTLKVPLTAVVEVAATVTESPTENPCATDVVIVTTWLVFATLVIVRLAFTTESKDRSPVSNLNNFVAPPANTTVAPAAVFHATTFVRFSDAAP